jgi:MFS family permease
MPYVPWLLIIFYSTYMFAGFFIGPSWSSWMRDLTEGMERGKYFGRRNKILGIAGLTATISAGLLLDWFKNRELVFIGFGMLFVIASIARMISRHYLKQQYEPKLKLGEGYYFSFWQFLRKAPTNNYGRFAIFFASINFATAIAGPFFAAYMLKDLHFSYITFTIVNLVITAMATLVMMPVWGNFIDKYGTIKTLQIAAFLIPINPILWLISPSIPWLIFVQIFSGFSWAGFNLAAASFSYDAVTKPRMGLCVAYTATLSSMGVFIGSVVGGLLASYTTISMNIYMFVFVVSGLARLAFSVLLSGRIMEVRPNVKPMKLHWKIWKPLGQTPFRMIGELAELPMHLFEKKR